MAGQMVVIVNTSAYRSMALLLAGVRVNEARKVERIVLQELIRSTKSLE
jgi:hypothetical protein